MGHEHAEGMAHVGVHVERTVRPGREVDGARMSIRMTLFMGSTRLFKRTDAVGWWKTRRVLGVVVELEVNNVRTRCPQDHADFFAVLGVSESIRETKLIFCFGDAGEE